MIMVKVTTLAILSVLSVYDGDTLTVDLADCGVMIACHYLPIRLKGYDAPELRDKRPEMRQLAIQARERMRELTSSAHKVELKNVGRDKYYRLDADIYSDGRNVGPLMEQEGLVRPYNGRGPKPW